jgi:hypothetical protein
MPTSFDAPASKFCTPQNRISELSSKLTFPFLDIRDDDEIEEVPTVIVDRSRSSYVPKSAARRVVTPSTEETSDDESLGSVRANLKLLFDEVET